MGSNCESAGATGRSGQIEGYRVFQGGVRNDFVYLALKNLQKPGFYQ